MAQLDDLLNSLPDNRKPQNLDDMLNSLPSNQASAQQSDVPTPQIFDLGADQDNHFLTNAINDVTNKVGQWWEGAKAGWNESQKENQALANMYAHNPDGSFSTDDNGNAIPLVDQDTLDAQNALRQKASQDFNTQTIEPIVKPAALLGGIPGIAAAPFIAKDAAKSYDEGGIGQLARDFTYGGAVDFLSQPNLGDKFYKEPVTTTAEGLLSVLPAALMGKGIYDGAVKVKGRVDSLLDSLPDKLDELDFTQQEASPANNSGNAGFEAFVNAISGQESGGNYDAVNGRTGASGKFQIMPDNWPSWAEEAGLGRDAPMTPENQDAVGRFKLRQYYDAYGPRGAAEAWYGGPGAIEWSDAAKNRKQGSGDEPSINEYADSVLARMGDQANVEPRRSIGLAPDGLSQADYELTDLPQYNDLMNTLQNIGGDKWDAAELGMNSKNPFDATSVKNPEKRRITNEGAIIDDAAATTSPQIVLPGQGKQNSAGLSTIEALRQQAAQAAAEGQARFDYTYKMAEAARAGDYKRAADFAELSGNLNLAQQYRDLWWKSQGFKDSISSGTAPTKSDIISQMSQDARNTASAVRDQIAQDRFNARQGLANALEAGKRKAWDKAEAESVSSRMNPESTVLSECFNHYGISPEMLEKAIRRRYEKLISDYSNNLRGQMKQGVEKRTATQLLDDAGNPTGEYKPSAGFSRNYQWYKDMLDANGGRTPNKVDLEYWLRETAKDHLKNGYKDPMYGEMARPVSEFTHLEQALSGLNKYRKQLPFEPEKWKKGKSVSDDVISQGAEVGRTVDNAPSPPGLEYMASGANTSPISGIGKALGEVSRREIMDKVNSLFTTVRTGRLGTNRALGWRDRVTEMIRTRDHADFPVVMHEIGHYLDAQMGLQKATAFDRELIGWVKNKFSNQYDHLPIERQRGEGIAEFISQYTTNRGEAARNFPTYFREFEHELAQHPDIRAKVDEISNMLHTWYNQSPEARTKGSIAFGDLRNNPQKVLDAVKTPKDTTQAVIEKGKQLFDTGYDKLIDQLAPLDRWMKQIEKVTGEKIPDSLNVFKQAWLSRGWVGKAQALIEHGVPEKGIPALKNIIKSVEKDIKDFNAYVVALREVDAYNLEGKTGVKFGHAISNLDAARTVAKYRQSNPEFVKAQQELVKYNNHLLDLLVDAGLKDRNTVEIIKNKWPNYVPFFREFSDAAMEKFLSSKGFGNVRDPIKKFEGSTRDIINPMESIIKNTYQFMNLAERNKVGRTFVDLAKKPGLGKLIEKVSGPPSSNDSTFSVWNNGKKQVYATEPELYRAIMLLDRESAGTLSKLFSVPAGWLRGGAVLSPEFMVRNPVRDAFSAFTFSKYGFIPGIDTARGVWEFVKAQLPDSVKQKYNLNDSLYWEYMNSGAAHSAMVSLDRDYLQQNLRQLLKKSTADKVITAINPRTYLNILRAFSEATEVATRLAEYRNARQGYTGVINRLFSNERKTQSTSEAALGARDITLDFSRSGDLGKKFNRYVAFWNAAVQGPDKMIRAFKENPVETSAKVALSITLPSIALYYMNRNDSRYQELPQWQKDLFWIIPTKDNLIKIPKPFELGILFGTSVERMLQWMDNRTKGDPQAFQHAFKGLVGIPFFQKGSLTDALTPGWMPTAMIPILEWMSNYSFFMDRNIVPQSQSKLPPSMQYGPNTSAIGKKIGELFNVSPSKVDNTIRGYTGGLGGLAMSGADLAAGAFDNRPEMRTSELPGIRAFTATPYRSSQSVQDFYDRLNEQEQFYNQFRQTRSMPEGFNPGDYQRLRAVDQIMAQLNKQEKQILTDPQMSGTEKRNRLDRLQVMAVNYARIGLGNKEKVSQ